MPRGAVIDIILLLDVPRAFEPIEDSADDVYAHIPPQHLQLQWVTIKDPADLKEHLVKGHLCGVVEFEFVIV